MIEELGLRDAQKLLHDNLAGHLGCVVDGEPYVVPIYYLYDEEALYIHSLPGRKINALRQHPQVCLQVEAVQDAYPQVGIGYAYVTSQMGTSLTGDPRDVALRNAVYSSISLSL